MKRRILTSAVILAACVANAEELAVVGSWSSLPLDKLYEQPYWNDTLPEVSGGEITATMTTHDQMGIAGGDVYRMLGEGVFDVGMTVADYAVADSAALEALDVPLLATEAVDERKIIEAARPMTEKIYEETFNAKVLAIAPYPPQVVFCNAEIGGLGDLAGKKVRASGRMTAKLLEALGAESVNVSFGEVPGALQRGVVDCAVTGAGSGYSAGWWEVSTHLLPLPIGGWDPVVTAINLDKWNSLSPEMQETISSSIKTEFEDKVWADTQGSLDNDIACLTSTGDCSLGDAHEMKLVEASEADMEKAREVLVNEVLPDWAERAGADWVAMWNDSVGKVANITIAAQ